MYSEANAEDTCVMFFSMMGGDGGGTGNSAMQTYTSDISGSKFVITSDEFKEVVTRSNKNRCHTVLILHSETDSINWLDEKDVVINLKKTSNSTDLFNFFQKLIGEAEAKLTYRDLKVILENYRAEQHHDAALAPMLVTSGSRSISFYRPAC
ncbi:MAG: hypothetical protein WDO15_06180 [Bacteroidota bacterium]